jgi:hypothetical protein
LGSECIFVDLGARFGCSANGVHVSSRMYQLQVRLPIGEFRFRKVVKNQDALGIFGVCSRIMVSAGAVEKQLHMGSPTSLRSGEVAKIQLSGQVWLVFWEKERLKVSL